MSTVTIGNIAGGEVPDADLTDAAKIEVEGADGQSYWASLLDLKRLIVAPEGPWTPVATFGGGGTGLTYSVRQGTYVRIGNLVVARCFLALSNKGSSTGGFVLGGLPFPSRNTANQYTPIEVHFGGAYTSVSGPVQGYLPPNSSAITFDMLGPTGLAALTDANFANTTDMMVSVSYLV